MDTAVRQAGKWTSLKRITTRKCENKQRCCTDVCNITGDMWWSSSYSTKNYLHMLSVLFNNYFDIKTLHMNLLEYMEFIDVDGRVIDCARVDKTLHNLLLETMRTSFSTFSDKSILDRVWKAYLRWDHLIFVNQMIKVIDAKLNFKYSCFVLVRGSGYIMYPFSF